jgi:hypothetical protein
MINENTTAKSTHSYDLPNEAEAEFNGESPDGDTLDLEIALLATTAGHDAGEPTETVDLDTLSHTEKQALLALLRRNLGVTHTSESETTGEASK